MQRFETKYDLLNAAYKDEQLKKGAISLLQYLVHKSNKDKCFPAVETIAKALNVCKRTVQYNMRKLEKTGYIIRIDRWYNHQQLTNQYIFNLDVTEDQPGQIQYTDADKEQISSLFNNDDQEQQQYVKTREIMNVYQMCLTGREKLLLINLIHRANKSGLTYRTEKQIMKDIGVGRRTLIKLLNALRSKHLIMVRNSYINGKEVMVIKLTCHMWMNNQEKLKSEEASMKVEHIEQKVSADQNQENTKIGQNRQSDKGKHRIRKNSFWNQILRKCKGVIQSGIQKMRTILRL